MMDEIISAVSSVLQLPEYRENRLIAKAVELLAALRVEGARDAEEAKDLLFDYRLAAKSEARLRERYETPKQPVWDGNQYICPTCKKFVKTFPHCPHCGQKLPYNERR